MEYLMEYLIINDGEEVEAEVSSIPVVRVKINSTDSGVVEIDRESYFDGVDEAEVEVLS